jgi:hypothetical protein
MLRARASLGPTLLAIGVAAELSAPAAAHAQEPHAVSPGITFSFSIGEKPAFGLGLDLRYTRIFGDHGCSDGAERVGMGVFTQITWLNFSAFRFAGGLHAGGEFYNVLAAEGELGWSYRSAFNADHPSAHGPHVGIMALGFPGSFAGPALEVTARGMLPWSGLEASPELTLGLGGRFPGPFGIHPTCVIGRPLRAHGEQVLAPIAAVPGPASPRARSLRMDPAARAALARAWADDAGGEGASIPAFLALADDLRAIGAPPELVRRALESAREEATHTDLCCALAGDYAGAVLRPRALPWPDRSGSDPASTLLRLALEAWYDGCLGEGAAAERARRSFAAASDPDVRAALAVIARDEERHAELSYLILSFCLSVGGRPVRDALLAAIEASEPAPLGPLAEDAVACDYAAWRAHGRLLRPAVEAAWEGTWLRAKRRGEALLRGRRS